MNGYRFVDVLWAVFHFIPFEVRKARFERKYPGKLDQLKAVTTKEEYISWLEDLNALAARDGF